MALLLAMPGARAHAPAQEALLRIEQFDAGNEPEQLLYLELVVNGLASGEVVPIRYRNGHYFGRPRDLPQVLGLGTLSPDQFIALEHLPAIEVAYDSATQRLRIDVPAERLPAQSIAGRPLPARTAAAVSFGMLLNYDVYTSSPSSGAGVTSLWSEQRFFDRWGTFSNTGLYRRGQGAQAAGQQAGYLRYDTAWSLADEDRLRIYTAGDLVTSALPWNSAIRLGGVSVEQGFKTRPDIITYPLPQFSGQAAVPSAVDLFINGSKVNSAQVNPGPFTFDTVPFINGAGEARVVTLDALGRQTVTTVPFYVASDLLSEGLSTYAVSAGAVRKGYGLTSFSYGKPAASASGRHGLSDSLTLEGHAELGKRFALAGVGAATQLGNLGVLNLAASHSALAGWTGSQYSAGYSYASRDFSVTLQRIQRTAGFRDLSHYDAPALTQNLPARASTQVTGAISLGRWGGTLGAGGFDVEAADGRRTRLVNLSYNRGIAQVAVFTASLNKTIGQQGMSAQIQLIFPFASAGTLSTSVNRTPDNRVSERVQYSRSVPSEGGLGFDLAHAGGSTQERQASATWRNPYLQIQGGLNDTGGRGAGSSRWLDLQGSLVVMGGEVRAANRVSDAFALIDTQGYAGVPVRYENQSLGKTDSAGRLLVPWVPSYYAAKYEIDPVDLPADVTAPVVEQRVAVRARSGAILTFPVSRIIAANIALVDEAGQPLPLGSQVEHQESQGVAVVGWGGVTYLDGLAARNHLRVTTPQGRRCAAEFTFDVSSQSGTQVGPLTCKF